MPKIFTVNPSSLDDTVVEEVARSICKGSTAIYPTETFYGIGAIYSDEQAQNRVFQIKERDLTRPMLMLIPDIAFIQKLVQEISPSAMSLAKTFWPGPLTLLCVASPQLSPLLTGAEKKVGIRISSNMVVQKLLHFLQSAITSSSANLSGGKSPVRIGDIPEELLKQVDIIIDAGQTPGKLPSTVLDVTREPFTMVRKGAISKEVIKSALGKELR